MATRTQIDPVSVVDRTAIRRVAAAVDPHPEGRDAVALGTALATAAGAEMVLLAIDPDLLLVVPGVDSRGMRRETEGLLGQTRDALAPGARTKVAADFSVSRGLKRLVKRERCDLLVVGSSRHAPDGEVRIGHVTRQLFDQLACPVVIAPRGLDHAGGLKLRRIAVGFDNGPEANGALATAAGIAHSCDAELIVRGVVDDRLPRLGWARLAEPFGEAWREIMDEEAERLRSAIVAATDALGIEATIQMRRGKTATALLNLSDEVDLLVIGSRRWGPLARLVLGGTGEALVHGARCSLMVVPRPPGRR